MIRSALSSALVACAALLLFARVLYHEEVSFAQESVPQPQPAQTLLDAAMKKAKAERKAVFVIFDASW